MTALMSAGRGPPVAARKHNNGRDRLSSSGAELPGSQALRQLGVRVQDGNRVADVRRHARR